MVSLQARLLTPDAERHRFPLVRPVGTAKSGGIERGSLLGRAYALGVAVLACLLDRGADLLFLILVQAARLLEAGGDLVQVDALCVQQHALRARRSRAAFAFVSWQQHAETSGHPAHQSIARIACGRAHFFRQPPTNSTMRP